MRIKSFAPVLIVGVLLAAAPAYADGFIVPSLGANFGGDAGSTLVGAVDDSSKATYGVAAGWMGNGIVGIEEDFSYSPSFYGKGGSIVSTRVFTLMTNVIVGIPIGGQRGGGVRPYVTGGLGLINRNVETGFSLPAFSSNQVGYDVGAGVMGYFSSHVGLRGEIRYFRNIETTDDNVVGVQQGHFNFARGSIGVLFRF